MAETDWDSKTVIGYRARGAPRTVTADEAAKAKRSGAAVETDKKATGGKNSLNQGPDHARIAKLDRENEVAPPDKIDLSVGRAIAKARLEKEPTMTQKDLAQKVNETATVIQSYENGKAIPSPQLLGKLERVLGVKLRGKDIGTLLVKGKAKEEKK